MKKIALQFLLTVLLAGAAHAQTVGGGVCTISDTLWKNDGSILEGGRVIISRVYKNGKLVSLGPKTYLSNASGIVSFTVPQGSVVYIYADVQGFNTVGGVAVNIPDSSGATCTYKLSTLQPLAVVGTAGITVQNNDVTVGNKHSTLDFSSTFGVTESPTAEANITIATGGITTTLLGTDAVREADMNWAQQNVDSVDSRITKIDSSNVSDGGLTTADIRASAITADKILADAVGSSEIAADAVGASELDEAATYALTSTSNTFVGLAARLDTLRITGNGGVRANDDTLYFRKADGSVAFKIYLGASPTNAQILKANADNVLTFQTDATGGGGGGITNAEYLVKTLTSDLTAERQWVPGAGLGATDLGANSTYTVFAKGTDGVYVATDTIRILLRSGSGLLVKSGAGAVDSLAADSSSVLIQTKTENNALYAAIGRLINAGNGLTGGGALSSDVTVNVVGSDGIKALADTVKIILANASGLEFVQPASTIDSLRIKLDGTTLAKSSSGLKVSAVSTTEITDGTIINQDVDTDAGIARTKLASGNANRVIINDGSGVMSEAGAGGLIETQINWAQQNVDSVSSRVTAIDSSRVTDGGLIDADIRVSTITGAKILNKTLRTADINWAQQDADSVTSRVNAATKTAKGIWYLEPIQVPIDAANTLAADTTWFWQNTHGITATLDSIKLDASTDNFVMVFVRRNEHGGSVVVVDTVTAATNGTNTFYTTDATFTNATIAATQWLGFKRPTVPAERANLLVFYRH